MALIPLEDAVDLGLIDPADYGLTRYAARGFPGLTFRPGATPFPRSYGMTAPFYHLPRLTGLQTPRLGLGPLLLGLGLSPQPSALTGLPGATVPTRALAARRALLSPEQQLEVIRRRVEEGVIDPRGLPAEVRDALAGRVTTAARAALQTLPGPLGQGLTSRDLAAVQGAVRRQISSEEQGGGAQQVLGGVRRGIGAAKDIEEFSRGEGMGHDILVELGILPTGSPARDAAVEAAYQDFRRSERLPFAPEAIEAGLPFAAENAARLAQGALPFTEAFTDPRFPGLTFPSTGPIEGVPTEALSQIPAEVAQGADIATGGLGAVSAAAPTVAEATAAAPELAGVFGEGIAGLGEAGSALAGAAPVLRGLGVAGGLAGAGLQFAQGNPAGGALGLIGTAGAFAPPPLNIVIPVASAILGMLTGGKGGGTQSVYQAKRGAAGAALNAGEAGFTSAAQRAAAAPTLTGLRAGLGTANLGTVFGKRSPIAISLQLPPDLVKQIGMTGGMPLPDRGIVDWEFVPERAPGPAWAPARMTDENLQKYLAHVADHPEALMYIKGSGDVAYIGQSTAEQAADRTAYSGRHAIAQWLANNGVPQASYWVKGMNYQLPPSEWDAKSIGQYESIVGPLGSEATTEDMAGAIQAYQALKAKERGDVFIPTSGWVPAGSPQAANYQAAQAAQAAGGEQA